MYNARVVRVEVIEEQAKSVLNRVRGMPFAWSINPYRGCSHGCVFCYARKTHVYHQDDGVAEWASKVYAKVNAPAVLRDELRRRGAKVDAVALGTATDPYQAIEGRYRITRGVLEVLRDYGVPVRLITRCPLIIRDIDVLVAIARRCGLTVSVSIATTDAALARTIEPTVAPPEKRLRAVHKLAEAGIDVGIALAPVLPGLTDAHEHLAAVIRAGREHGARFAFHSVLNLGEVTREAYFAFLRAHHPDLVPMYESMYERRYVGKSYEKIIAARLLHERRSAPLPSRRTIMPIGSGEQLTLALA